MQSDKLDKGKGNSNGGAGPGAMGKVGTTGRPAPQPLEWAKDGSPGA